MVHGADRIVAEINQGGALVESTLRTIDPNISYSSVHASRGKYVRAEPVSSLYEQNRIHHVGVFEKLEDQMVSFTADVDRGKLGSPDRVDAMVFGFSELLVTAEPYAGLFQHYEAELGRLGEPLQRDVADEPVSGAQNGPRISNGQNEPAQASIWDNPAEVLGEPVAAEMVPTLAGNGRIKWVPRQG